MIIHDHDDDGVDDVMMCDDNLVFLYFRAKEDLKKETDPFKKKVTKKIVFTSNNYYLKTV